MTSSSIDSQHSIALVGYNFDDELNLLCKFESLGKSMVTPAQVVNSTLMNCENPSWNVGNEFTQVSVWSPSSGEISPAERIHVENATSGGVSWALQPSVGLTKHGGTVHLEINGFQTNSNPSRWRCCFGDVGCSRPYQEELDGPWLVEHPIMNASRLVSVSLTEDDGRTVAEHNAWFLFANSLK